MADGKEKTDWTLNLDVTDALDALDKLQGGIGNAFNTDSAAEILSKFGEVGLALGAVAAAVYAVKTAMDLTFEGEQIDAVNQQFETLAENAGISGRKLKEGLEEAAGGLIDETHLLEMANKGMVELGASAQHLDQVMAIARQAAAVSGQDVSQSFEQITQAIASGQTRMLRHMGIIIDQKKAYDDYAKSIGVATNELSKEGQQQAILNAVLEKSKTAFEGIDPNVKQATNAFQEFKVAIIEIRDTVALAFEKTMGPTIAKFFKDVADGARSWNTYFRSFGEGPEAAKAKLVTLKQSLTDFRAELARIEARDKDNQSKGFWGKLFSANPGDMASAEELKKKISETEQAIQKLGISTDQVKTKTKESSEAEKAAEVQRATNLNTRRANLLKFQTELDNLRAKNLAAELKSATSIEQVNKIHNQQILAEQKNLSNQIQAIIQREGLSKIQKTQLIEQITKQSDQKLKQMEESLDTDRIHSLENFAQENDHVAKGFMASWAVAGAKASQDLMNFSKLGETAFSSLQQNFTSAFEAMGSGSKDAGEAMKDALLGALGQIAVAEGSLLLTAGIGELNPAKAAAGAALLALGGLLSGMAGGHVQAAGMSTGAGGGASFSGNTVSGGPGDVQSPQNLQQNPQKTVNLTIQGNYYDTNEAKTAMMDMIRSSTDATDFNLFKVGGQ